MPPSLLMSSLEQIWPTIDSIGLPVAVAGGIAMSFWGHPRSTQDIDLMFVCSDGETLANAFYSLGLERRSIDEKDLGLFRLSSWKLSLKDDYIDIEVDALVSDSAYYQAAVNRFVRVRLDGMQSSVRVLSREDLILHKLYAERLIDQADVISLIESHGPEIEMPYLRQWIKTLELDASWGVIQDRLVN